MKLALIGYGKMGKRIEALASERGHEVVARITSGKWDLEGIKEADVCIEFTKPEAALENIRRLIELKKPVVVGTTGWYDKVDEVKTLVEAHDGALIYSPNFSKGVALFLDLVAKAAGFLPEYDVAGIEIHHNQKKDIPSGTALAMVKRAGRSIPISSVRCGTIPGTHTVLFDSPCDTITITHEAKNRDGFALGAIEAAAWLRDKKGFFS